MELFLYCLTIVVCAVGIPVAMHRKNMTSMYFLAYCVLVAVPAGIVYVMQSSAQSYVPYFVSILLHQITVLLGLWLNPYNNTLVDLSLPSRMPLRGAQKVIAVGIVGACALYIAIGIGAYGGHLPMLDFIKHGTFPVSYRLHMWREVLPSVPFSSLLRSMAKTGCLFLGLRYLSAGETAIGVGVLGLAFIAATLEGTKIGAGKWAIPIALYLLKVRKVSALKVLPVGVIGIIGVLWASLLEANFDFEVAIVDKILRRVFLVPASVSIVHYDLTRDWHVMGASSGLILALMGGSERVFGSASFEWDNYVAVQHWYESLGVSSTYGRMNGPAFIYGWVDFGLVGVVIISVLCALSMFVIDKLAYHKRVSQHFMVIGVCQVVKLATSSSFLSGVLGIEGLAALLAFDMLLGHSDRLKGTHTMWVAVMACVVLYVLSGVVTRFS